MVLSLLARKLPTKSAKRARSAEELRQEARSKLLEKIRSKAGVMDKLQLSKVALDMEILTQLALIDSPRKWLREADCDLMTVSEITALLPMALEATVVPPFRMKCNARVVCGCCVLLLLLLGAMLFATPFFIIAHLKAGWEDGKCEISSFSQNVCELQGRSKSQECLLDVRVYPASSVGVLLMENWSLPLERDHRNDRVALVGEPFRCCDISGTLSCCNLLDRELWRFCDDWHHMVDPSGEACPNTPWPCLFKTGVTHYGEGVMELRVYEAPTILPFVVGGSICVFLCLAVSVFSVIRSRRITGKVSLCVKRLRKPTRRSLSRGTRVCPQVAHKSSWRSRANPPEPDNVQLPGVAQPPKCLPDPGTGGTAGESITTSDEELPSVAGTRDGTTHAAGSPFSHHSAVAALVPHRLAPNGRKSPPTPPGQSVQEIVAAALHGEDLPPSGGKTIQEPDDHPYFRKVDLASHASRATRHPLHTPIIEPLPKRPQHSRCRRSQKHRPAPVITDPATKWPWANEIEIASCGLRVEDMGAHSSLRLTAKGPHDAGRGSVHAANPR